MRNQISLFTYYFCRPFLGHHYYILTLYDLGWGVEKKFFIEIMHFHHMSCMTTTLHKKFTNFSLFSQTHLAYSWGSWNLQFIVLSCKRYIPNLCKDWPCSFWEGVNARRTTHDGRKTIEKGHSGDLIRSLQAVMVIRVLKKMYRHIYTSPFTITNEKNDKFAPYCFSKLNICQRIYRQHFIYLSFLFPSISSRHYWTIQTN